MKKNARIIHLVLNLNLYNNRTRMHRMARSFANNDFNVTILCMQDKSQKQPANESKEGFQIIRIKLATSKLPAFFNFIKYLEFIFRCKITVKNLKADIIHCHDFHMLPVGMVAKKKQKMIYDSHELETNRNGIGKFESFVVGFFEKLLIKRVDTCITVNEEIANIISNKYKVKVDYIYNAYSAQEIGIHSGNSIRNLIKATNHHFVVIYPGVISYGRGLSKIVDAAPKINEKIIFAFFGDGPYKKKLYENIRKLGLQKRIFMFDPVPYETVFQYMATSDLGIMPTLNTSLSYKLELGNKFFQYIAAGIPIGSSDQPVKKRLITKYDLGIIFDIENSEDVAKRFNLLVENKVRYKELKLNVLEAQKVFNWETEEKKLFHVYDMLFNKVNCD